MKILEITNYTAGGCGVGMRVLKESQLLSSKGHKVTIFSSNRTKGSNKLCPLEEQHENVKIRRFSSINLGGESYMHWNFTKEALKLNPDAIIVHAYRHMHNLQALKVAKKLGCKVFLVTHAPFARENSRTWLQNKIVGIYDILIGKNNLKKFDKIITITKWEEKHLTNLGVNKRQIVYIPNGIEKEFFKPLKLISKPLSRVIYTGRISPIKQLETLIEAMNSLKNFNCSIIGPAESIYLRFLNNLIKKNKLANATIINKTYMEKEQISSLDKSDIFVLPSKSEGMPQTLIEAMARGKIVIASNNSASKEVINNGKNGFLFKNGDSKELVGYINNLQNMDFNSLQLIRKGARKTAEQFKWEKIMDKLEELLKGQYTKDI